MRHSHTDMVGDCIYTVSQGFSGLYNFHKHTPVRSPRSLRSASSRLSKSCLNLSRPLTSMSLKPYKNALEMTPVKPIIITDAMRDGRLGL